MNYGEYRDGAQEILRERNMRIRQAILRPFEYEDEYEDDNEIEYNEEENEEDE